MKKHTKIYFNHFNLGIDDVIKCEYCNLEPAVDIHHIEAKGMGGSKTKDTIDNLIALCRGCHNDAHSKVIKKSHLKQKVINRK